MNASLPEMDNMDNKRPNILIVMTDQQRWDVCTPESPCRTPHMDRLIRNGLLFDRCFVPSPHCCPSRASFMTGLYPSQHGIFNNVSNRSVLGIPFPNSSLAPGVETFGEKMKAAGYRMVYTGKWHVSAVENPEDRGWEEAGATFCMKGLDLRNAGKIDGWFNRGHEDKAFGSPREPGEVLRPGWGVYRLYGSCPDGPGQEKTISNPQILGGYRKIDMDRKVMDHALRKLEEISGPEADPWCLYVGLIGPHEPLIIPERYARMYDPDAIPLPANYMDPMGDRPQYYQKMQRRWGQLSEREVRESIAYYYGYCTYLDDLLGELLDRLEQKGAMDNTLVIFTSDHGEMLGNHGIYCKGPWSFDENFAVPLVMHWPRGIQHPGRRTEALISLMDIAPTLLELSGAEPFRRCAGRSLVPFLEGGGDPEEWRDCLYFQCNGTEVYITERVLRTERYKLMYSPFLADELYDLKTDPLEMHNLHEDPACAGVKQQMYQRMWEMALKAEDHYLANEYATISLAEYGPLCAAGKQSVADGG
ncbi:MAG TPA: hypothetical protein DD727_03690 [Clostridiales bacterium]|nr:hypothetical protein [Clostridiales bacterium]